MGFDVFLSHSTDNRLTANALVAALEHNAVRCWIAPRDILPGENWPSAILRGIKSCRMMLVVFSEKANDSEHVQREVERAVSMGLTIVPVRIEDAVPRGSLEFFLSSCHWLDAIDPPMEQRLNEISNRVRRLLNAEDSTMDAVSSSLPKAGRLNKHYHRWAYSIIVILLITGIPLFNKHYTSGNANASTSNKALAKFGPSKPNNNDVLTNSLNMTMVLVRPGEFVMGDPPGLKLRRHWDSPNARHVVKMTIPLRVSDCLVTRGQFNVFVLGSGYRTDAERLGVGREKTPGGIGLITVEGVDWRKPGFVQDETHPVVQISRDDAKAFCAWLSNKENKHYRLPTEIEWEYFCRAGSTNVFFWGDDFVHGEGYVNGNDKSVEAGWAKSDGYRYTNPVRALKPNPWGFYDAVGNVWQMVSSKLNDPDEFSKPHAESDGHGLRGGSYEDDPDEFRCGYRSFGGGDGGPMYGFRVLYEDAQ